MIKDIARLMLVLTTICVVAAASVAATEAMTTPLILDRKANEQIAAVKQVLPEAERFENEQHKDVTVYRGFVGDNLVGSAFIVAPQGYNGPIRMAVGVDLDGKIVDVTVIQQDETPGLGTRLSEARFINQFKGKSGADTLRAGADIQAIAGATISSNAFARGVKTALDTHKAVVAGDTGPGPVEVGQVPDGVYRGQADGFAGPVVVDVKMEGGRIAAVTIVEHGETPAISAPAREKIPALIVEKQSAEVDAVAGATLTSKGIMAAVQNALAGTAGQAAPVALKDGAYQGQGEGFAGPITVEVTITGGKMAAVKILQHSETPAISAPAREQILALIVETQSTQVDAVAGATYTSEGIAAAVEDALAKAKQ